MKKSPARSSNPYLVLYEDAIKHASYRVKLEAEQVGKSWLDGYRSLLGTIEDYVWKVQDLVASDRHQQALVRLGVLKQRAATLMGKPVPDDAKQQLLLQLDVLNTRPTAESFD